MLVSECAICLNALGFALLDCGTVMIGIVT